MLNTEQHQDIYFLNDIVDFHMLTIDIKFFWVPLAWTCEENFCPQSLENLHIGLGHTGMGNIACNHNLQALKSPKFLIDGHQIQERLAWVLARAIPTIDDGGLDGRTVNQLLVVIHFWMTDNTDIHSKGAHG